MQIGRTKAEKAEIENNIQLEEIANEDLRDKIQEDEEMHQDVMTNIQDSQKFGEKELQKLRAKVEIQNKKYEEIEYQKKQLMELLQNQVNEKEQLTIQYNKDLMTTQKVFQELNFRTSTYKRNPHVDNLILAAEK